MDHKDFSEFAKSMVDYIVNYLENVRDRRVLPTVKPGYLRELIPSEIPDTPDKWQDVMADIERVIIPGITHWQSPGFHAYFPVSTSYPSIVANMLKDAFSCVGLTWSLCPAGTELDVVMLDWLCKMLGLPDYFLASSEGSGGGVIQASGSESNLVAMIAARMKSVRKIKQKNQNLSEEEIVPKIVCYTSEAAHVSICKGGLLSSIKVRLIKTDENNCMRRKELEEAIKSDKEVGLIPSCVMLTLGTTGFCMFDKLDEIGPLCEEEELWLHIDASYAGGAFICPEFRYLMNGIEFADSFHLNPYKLLQVTPECSTLWLKDTSDVSEAFKIVPSYVKHNKGPEDQLKLAPDFMHWQIFFNRTFRALKLWFVFRLHGKENLQKGIRKHISLAHEFESYVLSDDRFEIISEVIMGLVCFKLKGSKEVNELLVKRVNENGRIYIDSCGVGSKYFLRFISCSWDTESFDVKAAWKNIAETTDQMLLELTRKG